VPRFKMHGYLPPRLSYTLKALCLVTGNNLPYHQPLRLLGHEHGTFKIETCT